MVIERDKFLKKAREGVKKAFTRRDLHLIQAIRSIDDIDHAKNLLYTRVLEWVKLNFPELEMQNEEVFCRIIGIFGSKENLEYTTLSDACGEVKAAELIELAEKSFGPKINSEDTEALKALAAGALHLFETRRAMEKYIEKTAEAAFPNLTYLLDPMLATRLVAMAGGLERLAKMPGSTIQVLGAEKALFKHLKRGTNPPKHGLLFQCPMVRNASEDMRGKIARSLAAKLALAARADFYSGKLIAEKLKQDLEKRTSGKK